MRISIKHFSAILLFLIFSCSHREVRETKYPDGQVGEQFSVIETKNGSFIKDGEYQTWYPGKQTETSGQYAEGKKTGNWKYWYKNGQMKADVNYTRDTLDGSYVEWFENGQKKFEGKKIMGNPIGQQATWYANGKISAQNNYDQEGKQEGLQANWYLDGQKSDEANFSKGIYNGTLKYWDDMGKLYLTREFKDGVDINLPMVLRSNSGDILELHRDDTYTFNSGRDYLSIRKRGKFKVTQIALALENYYLRIKKFNKDSIIVNPGFGKDFIFVRIEK